MAHQLSCIEARERLTHYVQGKLPLSKTRQISAHLSRCRGCRSLSTSSTSSWKPAVRLFTVPAAALATAGVAWCLLFGRPSSRTPIAAQAASQPFPFRPGDAYYLRLHILNAGQTEKALSRVLAKSPVLQAKGPYAGRYYLTATPEQTAALVPLLAKRGDLETARVGSRRLWPGDPDEPNACSLVVDLLSPAPSP
ncbi:MAG: zf-HC2 domain-containing protein [Candidatus Omnitrophica bacterium]|nr:zf-HC2 domain-containing protein [Candidatus Omnitrophota bacterium]